MTTTLPTLAPIVLFVYKRADLTKKTLETLASNPQAIASELMVYADGAKSEKDQKAVAETREVLESITGFKSVRIIKSDTNQGLAKSVIGGVSEVISRYGKAIVLEDDLLLDAGFLAYMNRALDFYQSHSSVFSVSGYSPLSPTDFAKADYSEKVYFSPRPCSWGWATWKDRWQMADWENDLPKVYGNPSFQKKTERIGNDVKFLMWRQLTGQIDSWATPWLATHLLHNGVAVYPYRSFIANIGFGEEASHSKNMPESLKKDLQPTADDEDVSFPKKIVLNDTLALQFKKAYDYGWKYHLKLLFRRWRNPF